MSDGTAALSGEFYELPECRLYPKPLQSPVPVHVGGESDAALRRAAAHGQGWFSWNRLPDDLTERLARLDEELAARGRSRSDVDFELTICPTSTRSRRRWSSSTPQPGSIGCWRCA